MLLFRSEEHARRWSEANGREPGASFDLEQLWGLARAWYADRLEPGWRRRSAEEAEALFASLGLVGPFWRLTG